MAHQLWPVGQAVKTPASHAGNEGSSPSRVTIFLIYLVGVTGDEDPPVPIPNTEVKLISVENTWRVTAWEDRAMPTFIYSSLAQSVEHAAVNRRVVCSSQTGGAKISGITGCCGTAYINLRAFSSVGQSNRLITGRSRVRIPEGPPVFDQQFTYIGV